MPNKLIASIYENEKKGVTCQVETTAFEDPRCWGLVLADLLSTLAKSIADAYQVPEAQVRADLLELFDKENTRPTTEVKVRKLYQA